jgi:hypothetical protein
VVVLVGLRSLISQNRALNKEPHLFATHGVCLCLGSVRTAAKEGQGCSVRAYLSNGRRCHCWVLSAKPSQGALEPSENGCAPAVALVFALCPL